MKQLLLLSFALFFIQFATVDAQWQKQTSGVTAYLTGVHFVDSVHGWISGTGGTALRTSDGGANWTELTTGSSTDLRAVCFANLDTGWVIGDASTVLFTDD